MHRFLFYLSGCAVGLAIAATEHIVRKQAAEPASAPAAVAARASASARDADATTPVYYGGETGARTVGRQLGTLIAGSLSDDAFSIFITDGSYTGNRTGKLSFSVEGTDVSARNGTYTWVDTGEQNGFTIYHRDANSVNIFGYGYDFYLQVGEQQGEEEESAASGFPAITQGDTVFYGGSGEYRVFGRGIGYVSDYTPGASWLHITLDDGLDFGVSNGTVLECTLENAGGTWTGTATGASSDSLSIEADAYGIHFTNPRRDVWLMFRRTKENEGMTLAMTAIETDSVSTNAIRGDISVVGALKHLRTTAPSDKKDAEYVPVVKPPTLQSVVRRVAPAPVSLRNSGFVIKIK